MARRPPDYRDALNKHPKQKTPVPTATEARRWWTLDGTQAAQAVTSTLLALKNAQGLRLQQMVTSARLYGNLSLMGPLAMAVSPYGMLRPSQPGRSSFNVVQSVIDTVTAKIAKNKPEPLFLTSGGNFHQQRRAQRLTDYTCGVLYENKAHQLSVQVFKDACVWGSGIVHVFAQHGKVRLERVMPGELYVDELEAFYREPRQLHRVKAVDRLVIIDQFPDHEVAIRNIDPAKLDEITTGTKTSDLMEVRESWHLPSGPDADDGKHVITVGELVLLSEEWNHDWLPFAKLDWNPKQYGYWGQGLAEVLAPTQLELNQLSWIAQRSFFMAGSYKVFLKAGSRVVKEHLNDQVGAIVEYAGDTMPQYVVPPIISPQHLERIERLKQSAYELAGVSQLSANSQKPAGLNSGKALREITDIESDRFATVGQAFEQLILDVSSLIVRVSRQIAESTNADGLKVRVPGRRSIKSLDWAKCQMDEDDYITKVFPVSSLPNEPAGRLQTVQEYVQAGVISPAHGRRLLDFPDLQAEESLQNAQQEYLHKILDGIVDDGEFTPPEPYDDLQEARELALMYYAQGRAQDLEPERLQQLRDFLSQLDELEAQAQPQPQPGEATPQANPMAPPQSDLVPNVPGVGA